MILKSWRSSAYRTNSKTGDKGKHHQEHSIINGKVKQPETYNSDEAYP